MDSVQNLVDDWARRRNMTVWTIKETLEWEKTHRPEPEKTWTIKDALTWEKQHDLFELQPVA